MGPGIYRWRFNRRMCSESMAQILHCLQDLLPYESKATFWKSWETSFFLPNYDISVILFFFPAFSVLSTWAMLTPGETSLTPHAGRLKVIRHPLGWMVHYKHTSKMNTVSSLCLPKTLWKISALKETLKIFTLVIKWCGGLYHIDKRWPGHKLSSSSQLTCEGQSSAEEPL